MSGYLPRIVDSVLRADLSAFAGVLMTGARGVGKTRTALELANSTLRLDQVNDRSLVEADPVGAISGREPPLLIDEWQIAPEVLRAVKLDVDSRREPGRFIVTGSARNDLLTDVWPTTGRLIRLRLRGLVGRERFGSASKASLFDRWDDADERFTVPPDPLDLRRRFTRWASSTACPPGARTAATACTRSGPSGTSRTRGWPRPSPV